MPAGKDPNVVQIYCRGKKDLQQVLKMVAASRSTTVADLVWDALQAAYGDELKGAKNFVTLGTKLSHMASEGDGNGAS